MATARRTGPVPRVPGVPRQPASPRLAERQQARPRVTGAQAPRRPGPGAAGTRAGRARGGATVSATSARRFAARARAARVRSWRPLLLVVVAVAAVVALAWAVLSGPLLVVRSVRVNGLPAAAVPTPSGLTLDAVTAAADVPVGRPMLRLDTTAVRQRVAELPAVARVDVARAWPGTVEITVVERTPAAVVQAGSSWTLVDASGVAFATVPRRPAGLPLLTTPSAAVGAAPPAALTAAVSVVAALPEGLAAQVTQVSAQTPDHVVLSLTRGRTVVWGDAGRPQRKALVAQALLGQSTPKVTTVDVSAPDAPTTR